MLLQVENTRMAMKGYQRWAEAVNCILQNRDDAYVETPSPTDDRHTPPAIRDQKHVSLARDVVETLHQGAPTPAVMKRAILAFELSRRDERWDDYASANVVVAYCLIRIDMAPRALELIEEVWDTVLRIGDADAIALGEMVMGKIELERAFKSEGKDYGMSLCDRADDSGGARKDHQGDGARREGALVQAVRRRRAVPVLDRAAAGPRATTGRAAGVCGNKGHSGDREIDGP